MDRSNTNGSPVSAQSFYAPNEEQVALLQSILQKESSVTVSLSEAQEIAIQLVSLYECLARDRDLPTRTQRDA